MMRALVSKYVVFSLQGVLFLCLGYSEIERKVWGGRGEDIQQRTTGRNRTRVVAVKTKA